MLTANTSVPPAGERQLYRIPHQQDFFADSPPPPVEVLVPDWIRERYAGFLSHSRIAEKTDG